MLSSLIACLQLANILAQLSSYNPFFEVKQNIVLPESRLSAACLTISISTVLPYFILNCSSKLSIISCNCFGEISGLSNTHSAAEYSISNPDCFIILNFSTIFLGSFDFTIYLTSGLRFISTPCFLREAIESNAFLKSIFLSLIIYSQL